MRVALVGMAAQLDARALQTARALHRAGHSVTLLVPQPGQQRHLPTTASAWAAEGFACIPVNTAHLGQDESHFPRDEGMHLSRALAPVALAFDVAWFVDGAWALQTARERRFRLDMLPVLVVETQTGPESFPEGLADLNRVFARQYAERWADRVLPSAGTPDAAPQYLAELESLRQERLATPPRTLPRPSTSPAVTVCIPYFEEPAFLQESLHSLEQQTCTDFTVVVVDDGSFSLPALAAFQACEERYAHRGWRFLRQQNASPGAARNRAATEAGSEFLLFLDADDLLTPEAVERFLRGILLTGDDCLVARNYGFQDDPMGRATLLYDPPGNNLVASMGDDMHGGSCMILRRSSFQAIGGFTGVRGIGYEDYEFHVRANLEGLRWDVLPDFVYRYRRPRASGVSRTTSPYPGQARVQRWYERHLRPSGLGMLPLAFASAFRQAEAQQTRLRELHRKLAPRRALPTARGQDIQLLLLTCNFPFEFLSGWHMRVRQMVRFFGSRYSLSLMTVMPQGLPSPQRNEAFQHLRAVFGVEGSSHTAIDDPCAPVRVQEHYTDVFQRAVRSLPTDRYHALLMDQVFMAEFRKDVDSQCVLTEHNIESRLLSQAADRCWSGPLPPHYRNARTEAQRLARYEDVAWPGFPLRAVVSEPDRAEMERRCSTGKVVVAPNGADLSTWLPKPRFEDETVLFAGHLGYLPNVDAVSCLLEEIWPRVRARRPRARLLLAGRDPSSVVRNAMERVRGLGVELIASPREMRAVAARAGITVAPLRLGSGTRCKILESMAWGLPVVSTTLGAEGIDVVDGEHVLLRDDATAFADAVVDLLADRELWGRLRHNSARLVRERYSWDTVFQPLEDGLLQLIRR